MCKDTKYPTPFAGMGEKMIFQTIFSNLAKPNEELHATYLLA